MLPLVSETMLHPSSAPIVIVPVLVRGAHYYDDMMIMYIFTMMMMMVMVMVKMKSTMKMKKVMMIV